MKRIEMKLTRMAMVAICSAALAAPTYLLAQDTSATPQPPAQPAAGASQGQEPGGPGGPGGHMGGPRMSPEERDAHQLEMLTKRLSLTADQQTAVKKIQADSNAKMEALRDDTSTPREQKRDKFMQIGKDRQAAIRAVLTADQQTKFDADMAEMEQRRQEHMHGMGGHGGPGGDNTPPPPPPPQQ
jgi:Spy/CpxP family protein refolding chaperone